MCKQFNKHIQVIRGEHKKVSFSTTCPECFSKVLNHPELLNKLAEVK